MNAKDKQIPSYFMLLLRHFFNWLNQPRVMLGRNLSTTDLTYAERTALDAERLHRKKSSSIIRSICYMKPEVMKECYPLFQALNFEVLVVSPGKLFSLYQLRRAKTLYDIIQALRFGYPHFIPIRTILHAHPSKISIDFIEKTPLSNLNVVKGNTK